MNRVIVRLALAQILDDDSSQAIQETSLTLSVLVVLASPFVGGTPATATELHGDVKFEYTSTELSSTAFVETSLNTHLKPWFSGCDDV